MKFSALKTWMIAGVIALAGGTTAFVALDVTGGATPAPFVAQSDPIDFDIDNTPAVAANQPRGGGDTQAGAAEPAVAVNDLFEELVADVTDDLVTTAPIAQPAAVVATDTALSQGNGAPIDDTVRDYFRNEIEAVTADLLGMSTDALTAAREDGQSVGDLLEAAGISREDHQAAIAEAWPAIVQGAVDAGLITADEAADLLESGPRIRNGRNRGGDDNPDRDNDGRNGRGRGRGQNGNQPPNDGGNA